MDAVKLAPPRMSIEAKLTELGITLPEAPAAVAAYQPWIRTGNLVFTSGQLPLRDGAIAYTGKLGGELTEEDGYQAARQCALNAIAQLKAATGDLEKIQKIVRIEATSIAPRGSVGIRKCSMEPPIWWPNSSANVANTLGWPWESMKCR